MRRLEHFTLALDRSARVIDPNGFLRVAVSNISKAQVCPYNGDEIEEIPVSEGSASNEAIDPKRTYFFLRDPLELAKAAPSFNGVPLLDGHTPLDAIDLAQNPGTKEVVVGALGTDARFVAPYLQNSLVVWDAAAIERIESREQVELSCAYRWNRDMTPGTYEGVAYDGVMRELNGNHVALVDEGRAGPDVLVADAKPKNKESPMKKLSPRAIAARGALVGYLGPKLAADKKLKPNELNPLVQPLGAPKMKAKEVTAKLAADVKKAFAPRLAKDMSIDDEDLADVILSALGGEEAEGELDGDDAMPPPPPAAADEEEMPALDEDAAACDDDEAGKALMALLQAQNLPDDIMSQVAALMDKLSAKPAADDAPPPPKKGAPVAPPKAPPAVAKPAMDAAIKAAGDATVKRMQDVREAEDLVEPLIGKVRGQDNAPAIYRLALDHAKVDVTGVDPTAYRALVQMLIKQQDADDAPAAGDTLAFDEKEEETYEKRFGASRIGRA